jgi:hypothetical protein
MTILTVFSWSRSVSKGPTVWMFQKDNCQQEAPQPLEEKASRSPLCTGCTPREVIEKTQDILQSVVPSSLVATALSCSGKMVGEEAGHLTGQPWVHSLCGATFRVKGRKERAQWSQQASPKLILSYHAWCLTNHPISIYSSANIYTQKN